MTLAIRTSALSKTYTGGVRALVEADLEVPRGCCFGLLGPNGAGKSTLVKTLLSIVRATSGSAELMGVDIRSPRARKSVGYLPEGHRFPRYLTAGGVCEYYGRLSGLRGAQLKKEIGEKLELVGLSQWQDTKVTKFSKGMAQRVGVAQAMLGDPNLIFLDEPTDGVDPLAREGLRNVIRTATDRGATVFLNSHLLQEVEVLCDNVAILHEGKIVEQGSVADVTAAAAGEGLRVRIRHGDSELPPELWSRFESDYEASTEPDGHFVLVLKDEDEIPGIIDELRAASVPIYGVVPTRLRLEQAFIELVRAKGGSEQVARREA